MRSSDSGFCNSIQLVAFDLLANPAALLSKDPQVDAYEDAANLWFELQGVGWTASEAAWGICVRRHKPLVVAFVCRDRVK